MHYYRRFLFAPLVLSFFSAVYSDDSTLSMTCGSCATRISAVQGTGQSSPLIPEGETESPEIVIEAIVTASVPERLKGFFLQESITNEDDDPSTSEGLFIYGERPELKVGDKVRARGVIREFYGQTQMVLNEAVICGRGALNEVRAATPGKGLKLQEMEQYEGMLVNFSGSNSLSVTRNYSFSYDSYRNNMDVSLGGPLFKPTQLHPPLSDAAIALAKANDSNRMTLITDEKSQINGRISYYPAFGPYIHYIRTGDVISDLTGVIAYRYGRYELLPTEKIDTYAFHHDFSPRLGFPTPHTHGTIRVASFNVLNYFNTLMPDHKDNPLGDNRGATTLKEFALQRNKIVEAVTRIDADVIGLMEIENNGFGTGSAIEDLIYTLNCRLPPSEHYAAVSTYDSAFIGTDAITVGLIYKPSRVVLQNSPQIVHMPEQIFTLTSTEDEEVQITKAMRPTMLQTFQDKLSNQAVTVAVSHFKSKGSMCYEDYMEYADENGKVPLDGTRIKSGAKPTSPDYQDDLQGSCNEFRVAAAKHLGDHLKKMDSLLAENILLIGDFNAYGQEDPMRLLTQGKNMKIPVVTSEHTAVNCSKTSAEALNNGFGLINLVTAHHGKRSFSYSYDGELGALDHALANKALSGKITDVQDWHINSLENTLFEYPDKYSGDLPKDPGPFSASDHDPLLIDIDFNL